MAEIKRIIWSEEAWSDLESIIEYISKDSEYYAINRIVYKVSKNIIEILTVFHGSKHLD